MNIHSLKTYNWGLLWSQLNTSSSIELSDEQKLVKVFLLGYWWKDNIEANKLLKAIKNKKSAHNIWVKLMIEMANGEIGHFNIYLISCKKLKIDKSFIDWALIEFFGRSLQFENQADLFEKASKINDHWPYIAMIQSTEYPGFDPSYVANRYKLESITISDNIEKLAFKSKILCDLKEYESAKTFINDALKCTEDRVVISVLSHRLYVINFLLGKYDNSLELLDKASKANYMDFRNILNWLEMSISQAKGIYSLENRINYALNLVPNNIEHRGAVAAVGLVYFWLKGNYVDAIGLSRHFIEYINIKEKEKIPLRIFFIYICKLLEFKTNNEPLYICETKSKVINIVGESHSLALSRLYFNINSNVYYGKTHVVMGIKMHHLNPDVNSQFKTYFDNQIASINNDEDIIFTIGEIDCRPDQGIWVAAKKMNSRLNSVLEETVLKYTTYIQMHIKNKNSITIQGIPAPNYSIEEDLEEEEEILQFLQMIADINIFLKKKTLDNGWNFLDVYSATVGKDGKSNGLWHIDSHHLKPSFYLEADKWLINSSMY